MALQLPVPVFNVYPLLHGQFPDTGFLVLLAGGDICAPAISRHASVSLQADVGASHVKPALQLHTL